MLDGYNTDGIGIILIEETESLNRMVEVTVPSLLKLCCLITSDVYVSPA